MLDTQPLVEALRAYRRKGGVWADLSRDVKRTGGTVAAPTISRIAAGENEATPKTWEALYRARPDIIPAPPWATDVQVAKNRLGVDIQQSDEILSSPIVEIPVFDAGAGEPANWTDGGYPVGQAAEKIPIPRELIDDHSFAIRVQGESMAPTVNRGDIVVVVPSAELRNNDICFVVFPNGDKMIKRFSQYGRTIVLRSDNPEHDEITLDDSNGHGVRIYRVTQAIKRF